MDTSLKRIVAYVIDIAIVTILVTLVTKFSFLNPYMDEYNDNYKIYNTLIEDYQNKKISDEEYKEELIDINYKLGKYNVINGTITLIALVSYFGIVQCFMKGQTVGKKMMKVQLVSYDNDKKINLGNYLIRTVVLNNILFRILIIVGVYFLSKETYYHYSSTISLIESIIESVILIMVVLKSNNRGLHDVLAGTKVIDLSEPKYENEEVTIIETKEVKEKSTKKKNKDTKK